MRSTKEIPASLNSVLWSYDLEKLDLKKHKELIITQVLNYGTWKEVKWLFSIYEESEIREIITHPRRGSWWPKVLNFWLTFLEIEIPEEVYEQAVVRIEPNAVRKWLRGRS